jgi:hypothetical protein
MDEQYILDLFNQLGGESKFGKFDDFKELITTDNSYQQDFYNAFGANTLGEFNDFKSLVSATQQPEQQPVVQPTVKKKDDMDSDWLFGDGSSESEPSKTESEAGLFGRLAQKAFSTKQPQQEQVEPIKRPETVEEASGTWGNRAKKEQPFSEPLSDYMQVYGPKKGEGVLAPTKPLDFVGRMTPELVKERTPKFLEDGLNALTPKQLASYGAKGAKETFDYYFKDAGFKFETDREYVRAISPDGKVYTYNTILPSRESLDEFKNFVRESAFNNPEIADKAYLYEKENKKFKTKEEINNEVKTINAQEEGFMGDYKKFLNLQRDINEIEADLKRFRDSGEQNTPKYIQTEAYLNERKKELQDYAGTMDSKLVDLKAQRTQLDKAVGKYTEFQATQGDFGGNIYRTIANTTSGIFSNYLRLAVTKSVDFMPLSSVMGEEAYQAALDKKLKEKGYEGNVVPIDVLKEAKAEIEAEIGSKARDDFKKAAITGKYQGEQLNNVLTVNGVRESLSEFMNKPITSTKEYLQERQEKGSFIERGLLGFAGSLPAMVGGPALRYMNMFMMTTDGALQEMDNNPNFADVSENEKELVALPIGVVGAVLEEFGLKNLKLGKSITSSILKTVLGRVPANATASTIRKTTFDVLAERGIRAGTAYAGGILSEMETGLLQQANDYAVKDIYSAMRGKKMFDNPAFLTGQYLYDLWDASRTEGVGAGVMSVPYSIAAAYQKDGFQALDDATFKIFEDLAKDNDSRKFFVTSLKNKINLGEVTPTQGKQMLEAYDQASGMIGMVPDEITDPESRKVAMDLMSERIRLEKQKYGKDEALAKPIQDKINQINEQLTQLTQDAIQKQAASQVSLQPEAGAGQEVEVGGPEAGPQAAPKQGVLSPEEEEKLRNNRRVDLFPEESEFADVIGGSGRNSSLSNYSEVNGVGVASYTNPDNGLVDVIMSGTSDNDYVGYVRVYENGKPTNRWTSKMSNESGNKENFKTMISEVQSRLPENHEYTESTNISIDGVRVYSNQLNRGYEVLTDANGNPVTNTVTLNAASVEGLQQAATQEEKQSLYDNMTVTTREQFNALRDKITALMPNARVLWNQANNTVQIQLPVLVQSKKATAAETTPAQKTFEQRKSEIEKITDPEQRKVAEIEFIMSNLMSGVGEASANKIREYADRIISGKETRDQVIQGLPKSFVDGIDQLLAAQQAPTETTATATPTATEATPVEQFTEQDRARKAELEEAMRKADKRRKNITVGETTMPKAEAKAELDALNQKEQAVIEAEVQAIEKLISAPEQKDKGKIKQAVTNAAKAIAKILPKTKIVIHETNDDYVNATGDTDGASGIYIPSAEGGTIHVNLSNANTRTVGHEVFHAILLRGIKTDAEAQRLAKAMIGAVAKSLKQSGANQELLNELEDFLSNYEENIQNEEYLAEVFGYLADGYPQLDVPAQSIINRFIERIMKLFGLKPMTDKEVIDFMNTLSRKVAAGEEITEKEVGITKKTKGISSRQQKDNNTVNKEVSNTEKKQSTIDKFLSWFKKDNKDTKTELLPKNKDENEGLLNRLSQEEERGRESSSSANVSATIVAEGVHRANSRKSAKEIKKQEEIELEAHAKESGFWIDPSEFENKEPHGQGAESDVFVSNDGTYVTKIKANDLHYSSWLDFLDSIALHNSFEHNARYILKGFTKYKNKFRAVLEQPFIRNSREATRKEIDEDLLKKGFKSRGLGVYINDNTGVFVGDLLQETGNALIVDDVIFYIDPIIKPNTYSLGFNGKRKVSLSSRQQKVNKEVQDIEQLPAARKQIIGENAKLAQEVRDNLQVARNMETAGKDAKTIRITTGWEKGKDNKWRYEIDDADVDEVELADMWEDGVESNLENLLLDSELLKLYPQLKDIKIKYTEYGKVANYDDNKNKISIPRDYGYDTRFKSVLLHEIQHAIQVIEGFALGGSPEQMITPNDVLAQLVRELPNTDREQRRKIKEAYQQEGLTRFPIFPTVFDIQSDSPDKLDDFIEKLEILTKLFPNVDSYKKLQEGLEIRLMEMGGGDISFEKYQKIAGEVEARNVQTRMDMTPEQRRQTTLQETEDVAREDQVIFFDTNLSPRQQKSKNNQEIIKQARANGKSEAGIRAYFKKNGLSDIEIDILFDEEKGAGKKISLTEETLPGYTKLMNRINDIIARGRRKGKTDDDIMKGVIANVESRSPEYANATDQQREQIIRDIRKLFGKKEKAAPSAAKITGKPKPKKVTVDEMTALKDQLRLEARAAREAKGDLNAKRKMLAAAIKEMKKKGSISVRQAKALINRINAVNLDNPVMVERLLTYAENIFNDADYDTRVQEVRKLQEQVKKVNHVSMRDTVREFASINPERIPADKLLDYIQALDDMNTRAPFYEKMNDMFDEVMSYRSESKEFDAIKTFQALIDKLESIAINQVKSVEDYVALVRDINSFKRKAYQLLQNGDITQDQYDQAIENVGKDQAAVEKKYEKELTALKKGLVQEIMGLRPEVHPDFTPEEAALINKYLELSESDLESLSPEDLYILNDLLNNIKEDVQLDYYRLSEIVSKAYTNAGGQKLAEQLNESKFNKSSDEGKKLLLEQESAFWEGLLGLGRATSGALQKFIVSPFNRAIASFENFMKDGYSEFSKLKKKYRMKDYNMHRLGVFTTYLQEYMAQFDPANKNVKDIGKRDWFGEILGNEGMRDGYKSAKPSAKRLIGMGDTELKTIEKIYKSLPKDANGKVDPKAVYDSFMANDGKFFTKQEKAFFDKVMEWKQKNLTTKQKAANEMSGMPFKEIPFHMMRVRLDRGAKQISPKAEGGAGKVRIEAGTGKERAKQTVGPIMTNFEQLFTENLEQTARNYYLREAINDINNTLSVAKKGLDKNKTGLFNTIPGTISDALNFEFDKTDSQVIFKSLLAARAAETLFNPIRTAVELTSAFLSYPFRAKTPKGYRELFGKQGKMKKLLDFTDSPIRLRDNINKAIDISDGRIKPLGKFEKAVNYLSGLPERTMLITSWMPTFNNEFKDITNEKFDMDKFNSSAEYRQKYGKAIKEAAAVADAQTEKIIGSTTKAGGRREIRIAPKILANVIGLEGTVKKNSSAGQILGFFSNYPYREVTEFLNGFREAAEVYKQGGKIKSISQLQKPLGVVINLAAYGFLSSVVYAMKLMLLGDDEDEEKGEAMLKELMTPKGFMDELQGNAISLGASKYAAGGKAMLQMFATIAYNSTSDKEQKARIKKILKNSVFVEPIDAEKVQGYGGKNELLGAISSYVPQVVLFAKRIEETIQTAGELNYIYKKFQDGGLKALSEDEGLAILAIDGLLKTTQTVFNFTGTSLPMYNDIKMYMKGAKKEAGVGNIKLSATENQHKKALQNYKNEKEFKENDPEGYLKAIDEGGSLYEYKLEQSKKEEEANKDKPFRGMSEEAFKKKYPEEYIEKYGPDTEYYEEQRTPEAIEKRAEMRALQKKENAIKAKNKKKRNERDKEE